MSSNDELLFEIGEKEKKEEVLDKLKDFKTLDWKWVHENFKVIIDDRDIRETLNFAYRETSIDYINKHGVIHGLVVASNVLDLFKLIADDIVGSDYERDFGFKKEHVLFALLTAGYVHDGGRFYVHSINHEEEVSIIIKRIVVLMEKEFILRDKIEPKQRGKLINKMIRELCLCHDKKVEASGKAEIALLKLADALDCSKDRVYTEREHKSLKGDHSKQMAIILSKDRRPESYFGCLGIEGVEINWNDRDGRVDVITSINDHAAFVPIKTIHNVLKECEKDKKDSVKELSRRIHVFVKEDAKKYNVYPENPEQIPGAEFVRLIYNIDVLDIDTYADTEIEEIFEIRNAQEKAGITSRTVKLFGDKSTDEKDTYLRMFKLPKNFSIEQFESAEIQSPKINEIVSQINGEELSVQREYSEDRGKAHVWTVSFGEELKIGDTIKIIGKCLWKQCTKIKEGEFTHTTITPCKHLVINVFFPKEVSKENIDACFEIRKEGEQRKTIYYTKTPYAISYSNARNKSYIHFSFDELEIGYMYRAGWKLKYRNLYK